MIEIDKLIEQLADQEHERWSGWMRYLFDHWTEENVSRWKQQMVTAYAELPEHSKESDRKEARKTMEIVGPLIAQLEDDLLKYGKHHPSCPAGYWFNPEGEECDCGWEEVREALGGDE